MGKVGGRLVIRFVFMFFREKALFVRESQGIWKGPACGNHVLVALLSASVISS